MKNFVERLLGAHPKVSAPMGEEDRIRLANEIDKELHRRKIEMVLLYFLGFILATLLLILVSGFLSKTEEPDWAKTCMISILGFITGFLSARKQEPPARATTSGGSATETETAADKQTTDAADPQKKPEG